MTGSWRVSCGAACYCVFGSRSADLRGAWPHSTAPIQGVNETDEWGYGELLPIVGLDLSWMQMWQRSNIAWELHSSSFPFSFGFVFLYFYDIVCLTPLSYCGHLPLIIHPMCAISLESGPSGVARHPVSYRGLRPSAWRLQAARRPRRTRQACGHDYFPNLQSSGQHGCRAGTGVRGFLCS